MWMFPGHSIWRLADSHLSRDQLQPVGLHARENPKMWDGSTVPHPNEN